MAEDHHDDAELEKVFASHQRKRSTFPSDINDLTSLLEQSDDHEEIKIEKKVVKTERKSLTDANDLKLLAKDKEIKHKLNEHIKLVQQGLKEMDSLFDEKEFDKYFVPIESLVVTRILTDGVFRLDANQLAKSKAAVSLSFTNPNQREQSISAISSNNNDTKQTTETGTNNTESISSQTHQDVAFLSAKSLIPSFEFSEKGQNVRLEIPTNSSVYGCGEVACNIPLNNETIRCWNTDAYGYEYATQRANHLYQSHPWVFRVDSDGFSVGILADTTYECFIDLRNDCIEFQQVPCGEPFPLIIFTGASPQDVLRKLALATGTISLPPKWSLGYHQCRWSYTPSSRVYEVSKQFRNRHIPLDVIWCDIDYMDEFKIFTFNPKTFSDHSKLIQNLHEINVKSVWMIDPGVKAETDYSVYEDGKKKDIFVKTGDKKSEYFGECWPGSCVFPDFTMTEARAWWSNLTREFVEKNAIDGLWNDMNEPAIFKVVTKTMPLENYHRGDTTLGGPNNHTKYHNVYGMLMTAASFEGLKQANEKTNKRPFLLTRSGYMGSQRYCAMWTGDNLATWQHLALSIPMTINMGLSGQPFSGPDIGGFGLSSDMKEDGYLFGRWMGIGALLPFCRAHSQKLSANREPYEFGTHVENISRAALIRRYRLLPHLYTLFYESHRVGIPIVRPVFFADPTDLKLRNVNNQFLLGEGLLVSCQVQKELHSSSSFSLPSKGIWRPLVFAEEKEISQELPLLHVKGGTIIPMGPAMEYVDEKALDPLSLVISIDENGFAQGTLYEDSGDGYDYLKGDYLLTTYTAQLTGKTLVVEIAKEEGKRKRITRKLDIRVLYNNGDNTAVITGEGIDGQKLSVTIA